MDKCPFCEVSADRIFLEISTALAIFDCYPLTEGHALVIPRQHVASIYELGYAEQADLWSLVRKARESLNERFHPDGFNLGLNDGRAAGQTVFHAHIHIIPRRSGDVPDPRGGIRWIIPEKSRYW